MNNLKKIILYFLAFSFVCATQSILTYPISARAFYNQNNNVFVMLLGDLHAESAQQPEEAQLLPVCDAWFQHLINNHQFRIYIEGYKEAFERYKSHPVQTLPLVQQYWFLSQLNNSVNTNVYTYDPRTGALGSLVNLFFNYPSIVDACIQDIIAVLTEKNGLEALEHINNLKNQHNNNAILIFDDILFAQKSLTTIHPLCSKEAIQTIFFQHAQQSDTCWNDAHTCWNVKTDIETAYNTAHNLLKKAKILNDTQAQALWENCYKKIDCLVECFNALTTLNPALFTETNTFHNALWENAQDIPSLSAVFGKQKTTLWGQLFSLFYTALITDLPDVEFVQKATSYPLSLLYAGDGHCEAIAEMLANPQTGFVKIFEITNKNDAPVDANELSTFFTNVTNHISTQHPRQQYQQNIR